MQLLDILNGTATCDEFLQAYDERKGKPSIQSQIASYTRSLGYYQEQRIKGQAKLSQLQEIELWTPEKLTLEQADRMVKLRNHIANCKSIEAKIRKKLAKLLAQ